MPDFTVHRHPALAVRCPTCSTAPGLWCRHPKGQRAGDLHKARRLETHRLYMEQHGELAAIIHAASGWLIDPRGRARD